MKPGGLYAIKPNGTLKWIAAIPIYAPLGYGVSSPAIALDGTLYVGGGGGLYAVNPDGGIKWIYKKLRVASSPAIDASGVIYFAPHFGDPYVYAVNPNGTLRWKYKPDQAAWFVSSPAIGADGTVYIGVKYARNKAFQGLLAIKRNGTLKWTYPIDGGVV